MFFRQLTQRKRVVSLIGAGTRIIGTVKFHDDLRIDGEIRGDVCSDNESSTLVVSEHGLIDGSARASHLIVSGTILGTAVADNLELRPTSRITGDVAYGVIEVPPGVVIQGRLTCHRGEPTPFTESTNMI
ncbi:hypothetical protein B9N43_04035 [Denitratisoma sp. DHT3]|uniref:bactofilin family protein n=1 Tax=Denitratisoma sp. DHT3 TaxID=1981880 RepID=UPI0011987B49|nr:polymer-forming cytoskeletal protein [Denitratisoma sp. DHT3]QDX80493.1 hypothetical protein B9N43_04035 [Denitratisoma sp. DHT3]